MRPAGSGSAALVNYLNEALSARGPNALPYANDVWWPIREHVVQLLQARTLFGGSACCVALRAWRAWRARGRALTSRTPRQRYPSLSALSGSFTHNDGRTAHLLRCEGTLPIVFQARPSRDTPQQPRALFQRFRKP